MTAREKQILLFGVGALAGYYIGRKTHPFLGVLAGLAIPGIWLWMNYKE